MKCHLQVEITLDDTATLVGPGLAQLARDLQAVIEVGMEACPGEILPGVVHVQVLEPNTSAYHTGSDGSILE